MRAPRSYREALIFAVARARERLKNAKKAEARFYRLYGKCPDDQIIYEVYEASAAYDEIRWALDTLRLWEPRSRRRSPRNV